VSLISRYAAALGSPDASRRLLRWATSAAMGGFAFGYELAVISGALLFVRNDFGLSNLEQGALVSILPLGAMAGGLLAGRLADALGRRRTLIADAVLFLAAIGLSVAAPSYAVLLAARGLVGLAVGIASSAVPLYLSELAPPHARGRLVTLNQLTITTGILVAYCVCLAFAESESWRAMFGMGAVPAAVLLAGMLRAPETPAWLEAHGEVDAAREVMLEVADEAEADRMLEDIRRSLREQAQIRFRELLKSNAAPALMIGVVLAAAQQFAGINAIISYAPSIMEQTGLDASNSILYSLAIAAVNVAATIVSLRLIDRTGRRPLLLGSLAGMLVSLTLLGVTFEVPHGALTSWLSLACLVLYIAAFAVGIGPVFWVLVSEIFPSAARATGAAVSAAVNWLSSFLVGLGFLPVAQQLGTGPTFWVFAGVCALALAFSSRFVVETKGRSFSEIDADLRARRRAAV
jgi:MFS transporter, SP family, galactose:H+ symporter